MAEQRKRKKKRYKGFVGDGFPLSRSHARFNTILESSEKHETFGYRTHSRSLLSFFFFFNLTQSNSTSFLSTLTFTEVK